MADIVSSLFGLTPMQEQAELTSRQRNYDLGTLIGQAGTTGFMTPTQSQNYVNRQAAQSALAGTALRGIGGLFGLQDPQLKRATQLEGILGQTQQELGEAVNNPAVFYPELQRRLAEGGFGREAMQVSQVAQKAIQDYGVSQATRQAQMATAQEKMTQSQLNVAKTFKELQPELTGIEKLLNAKERIAQSGGDTSAVDAAILKDTQLSLPSIDEQIVRLSSKRAQGTLTPAEAAELDYLDNFKNRVASSAAPRSITNVATGKAEDEFAKLAGKFGVERQTTLYETARGAVNNLSKIDTTINLLNTSDARTGFGADVIKNIDRVVASLGGKEAAKKASDTELLNALLGSEVFPQIGALGIGARGLDTPAEREFLREVMAGTITMNKDTLLKMAKLRRSIEERALNNYNKSVDAGELDSFFQYSKTPKAKFSDPSVARVGQKEYKRPPNFTNEQWEQYKQSVGAQ